MGNPWLSPHQRADWFSGLTTNTTFSIKPFLLQARLLAVSLRFSLKTYLVWVNSGRPASLSTSGGLASGREVAPRFLLDLLRQQSKTRRRSRKSMVGGGRGCFGMKMDRIGSISGLGC
uniref:Uncharacterized protein n=1 Tax=Cyclopterus lumpus TaxID=8103 RepID=A0A8C2WVI8_CYCLU